MGLGWSLLLGLGCAVWIVIALRAAPSFFLHRPLEKTPTEPRVWPRLSVVVAACDEAQTIEAALRTLVASDYPNLEVVVVEDRSRDATGTIVDALSAELPQLRVIHVTQLPAGWLGKVHALAVGAEVATGSWLLFTDADVHFRECTLRRAVATAIEHRLDHLTLWPSIPGRGLALRSALVAFAVSLLLQLRPHRIGRIGSQAFLGIGAFNLVRRRALEFSAGFAGFRMEVGDDVALGKTIVDAGGRSDWRQAPEDVWVEWYPSLAAMTRGLEKNVYGVFSHFRVSVFLLKLAVLTPIVASPMLALALPTLWWAKVLGATAVLVALALVRRTATMAGFGWLETLGAMTFAPLYLAFVLFRSAWKCWRSGGIHWRGTFYGVPELQVGARLRI